MQTLLESLYAQETTFGETDFSALCVHLAKHIGKRSLLILYTNFSNLNSMNRQLPYLQQLSRQHRLLVVFFEDAAYEKRLIVNTLKQHGIYSVLTTPDNLSVDVINKYLEMKSRQLI